MSFNENNPPTSSLLISGDMRANFLATRRHMYSANYLQDPLYECWAYDDATVPATWNLSGTGALIARVTTAIDIAVGKMSARVTYGSAVARLWQYIINPADYDSFFDGRVVTAGCFVKTATGGIARIRIDDGAATTDSAYHTGGGAFEWLDLEHLINPAATYLSFEGRVEGAGNAIFSGPVFLFSDIKPDRFVPTPLIRETLFMGIRGAPYLGFIDQYMPQRPFIVEQVALRTNSQPVTNPLIADVLQWDGTTFTSMFTAGGRPRVAVSAYNGYANPDSTYNRRCFSYLETGAAAAPGNAGILIRSEVDAPLPTAGGDTLGIHIRYKAWKRPQEIWLSPASVR